MFAFTRLTASPVLSLRLLGVLIFQTLRLVPLNLSAWLALQRSPCGNIRTPSLDSPFLSSKILWIDLKWVCSYLLHNSLRFIPSALEPVVSAEQYSAYESAIEEFRTTSGPAIHAQLENLEKKATYNWMEGYWQSMYEKLRCPLPINVSPYLVLGPDPNPVQDKSQVCSHNSLFHPLLISSQQILKAASHLAATARFVTKLRVSPSF